MSFKKQKELSDGERKYFQLKALFNKMIWYFPVAVCGNQSAVSGTTFISNNYSRLGQLIKGALTDILFLFPFSGSLSRNFCKRKS